MNSIVVITITILFGVSTCYSQHKSSNSQVKVKHQGMNADNFFNSEKTMKKLKDIWGKQYGHTTCEPLTQVLIDEAESLFNVKLPQAYLKLLEYRNGGVLRYNDHPKIDMGLSIEILGIGHQVESILDTDWDVDVEEQVANSFPKGANRLIQLMDGGGRYICLDYRGLNLDSDEPKVSYINIELESDYVVAESFTDYLTDLVYSSSYFEFIIQPENLSDKAVISKIESVFKLTFEDLRNNDSFESLRGRITSADYKEIVTSHPKYGIPMTRIEGKFVQVWLSLNQDRGGYIHFPNYNSASWVLRLGDQVLSLAEMEKKLKQSGLSFTRVYVPKK